ncbi:uncharacterized protein BP01DRAFT_402546 [Aspergillus saccharolyticus JOP 1030-1]|uniref:Uncharacterized protein n=1 Tax=Aspergillus saccharolyticus JOP 1030-1 TaxID=1450539 RepID=A0A318Z819_9EURO|nr:hypothetical protein BP01DRAFT_402546 [Aspergillus saccharolyticus JOP 1030-1]PYH43465.1 hypothetical protein BP01DRAFT_402546 [Aspergillus saccharolyticus JOP 1030-1]
MAASHHKDRAELEFIRTIQKLVLEGPGLGVGGIRPGVVGRRRAGAEDTQQDGRPRVGSTAHILCAVNIQHDEFNPRLLVVALVEEVGGERERGEGRSVTGGVGVVLQGLTQQNGEYGCPEASGQEGAVGRLALLGLGDSSGDVVVVQVLPAGVVVRGNPH